MLLYGLNSKYTENSCVLQIYLFQNTELISFTNSFNEIVSSIKCWRWGLEIKIWQLNIQAQIDLSSLPNIYILSRQPSLSTLHFLKCSNIRFYMYCMKVILIF